MTFEQIKRFSPVVRATLEAGGTAEDCVVKLYETTLELHKRILELEMIAPKKVHYEGKTYVYRCPDDLVPGFKVPIC